MRRFLPLFVLSALFTALAGLPGMRADAALVAAAYQKPVSLSLNAAIAQGARKMVKSPVTWTVVELFNDKKPGAVVATANEASPTVSLPPGHYLVTAKLGQSEGQQTVQLEKAPVKLIVNLNAGVLRVNLIPYAGAKVVSEPVHWELFRYTRGGGAQERIAEANAPAWEFILPAGGYVLRAAYQGTRSELVVPLDAGQTFNYTLNLYAGKVKATAVGEKGGGFKDPVSWEIVRAADRTQLVATDTAKAGQFTLREGRYIVLARQGNLAGEAPLEVKAGKSSSVKVTLKTVPAEQVAGLEKAAKDRKALADAALVPKAAAAAPVKQVAAAPAPAPAATALAAAAAQPAPAQPAASAAEAAETAAPAAEAPAAAPVATTASTATTGASAIQPSTTRSFAESMKLAEDMQKAITSGESAPAAAASATQVAEAEAAQAPAAADAASAAAPDAAPATEVAAAAPTATAPAADAAAPTAAGGAPAAAAEAAPPADAVKGSVRVSAWSKVSEKFQDPVEWQIRRIQASGAVVPDLIDTKTAAAPKFALPAGTYVIWGRQGTLIGKQKFEVAPDKTVAIRVFMQTPKLTEKSASTTTSAEPVAPAKPLSGG